MASRNAPERPSIDSNFAGYTDFCDEKLVNFMYVVAQVVRRDRSFRAAVAAIVPDKYVDAFVDKEAQVVRVALVDHLLVEHGVRVAYDKCWFGLPIFELSECLCQVADPFEEHTVQLHPPSTTRTAFNRHPVVVCIKCLF